MLDLLTSPPLKNNSATTACSPNQSVKCDRNASTASEQTKTSSITYDSQENIQKHSLEVGDKQLHPRKESLISLALLTSQLSHTKPGGYPSPIKPLETYNSLQNNMNEKIAPPSLPPTNILEMSLPTSKSSPTGSASSSLKLLPKKFSPFSVDSLLSHKEKQVACDDTNGDSECIKNSLDFKNFEHKDLQQKIKDNLSSGASAFGSAFTQDIRSQALSQDSIGIGHHHLSIAKFLLNNNLHDRNNSDSIISRVHSLNVKESSDLKDKFENQKSKKCSNGDPRELQTCTEKRQEEDINGENGSSNENDIDVCGDEADMDDEDAEYHDDINDIKSESNYHNMMSDEDVSGDEDMEHNDLVKTEDIEDDKSNLESHLQFPSGNRDLTSRSDLSPRHGPMLSPRFPLGFPMTSASPNPFSPPSPSNGMAGSSLPRPTPSLPWLPQFRSPLHMPGFIGSKY